MDAVPVIIGTIVGALVGILGTLLAQREANRAEDRRFQRTIDEQRRSELHLAINELLSATQFAEQAAEDQHGGRKHKSDASHSMWIAHKRLTLICADPLKTAADSYCDELGRALWNPDDEPVWSRVRPSSLAFRDMAHSELEALRAH